MKVNNPNYLNGLSSSAGEIDGNIINSISVNRNLRDSGTTSHIFGKTISILGDSLTSGSSATNFFGYAYLTKDVVNAVNNVDNYGLTGLARSFNRTGKTIFSNETATESLCGEYYPLAAAEICEFLSSANFRLVFANRTISLVGLNDSNGKTCTAREYNSSGTLLATTNITFTNRLTNSFVTQSTTYRITIENTSASSINIESLYIMRDTSSYNVSIMAHSGRKLAAIQDEVIDKWFDNAEYAVLALGTNDTNSVGFKDRIDYIIQKYNSPTRQYTKLVIIYMDSADTFAYDDLKRLHESCKGSIFVDYRHILSANYSLSDRDELVTLGMLNVDRLHFTDYGHKYLSALLLSAMGFDSVYSSYKMVNVVSESLVNINKFVKINETNRTTAVGDTRNTKNITTSQDTTAIGARSLEQLTSGNNNTAVGSSSIRSITTGVNNVALGSQTLRESLSGNNNTALGYYSLVLNQDGSNNTAYSSCTGLGANTYVSGSNQVQVGGTGTTTYAYGAVQDRSDIRDKADIEDTPLGLDFICKINPVQYRWDYRDDYIVVDEETSEVTILEKDGSKKRSRLHQGVIAQQVKEVIDELGVDFGGYQDHSLNGGCDVKSIGYQEFIPPLIKAIQELKAEIEILKSKA